jgi:hypothetical protein
MAPLTISMFETSRGCEQLDRLDLLGSNALESSGRCVHRIKSDPGFV